MAGIADPLSSVLTHARTVTDQLLHDPAVLPDDWEADKAALQQQLHPALFAVLSTGRSLPQGHRLAEQQAADLWHIVCKLWVRSAAWLDLPDVDWPRLFSERLALQGNYGPTCCISECWPAALQNFCVGQHNARGKPESWLVALRQFSRRACFALGCSSLASLHVFACCVLSAPNMSA